MVGHRADLTGRLSGSDHHIVRDARFAGKIDNDDISCLVIFELIPDQCQERFRRQGRLNINGYDGFLIRCRPVTEPIIAIFPIDYSDVSSGTWRRLARMSVADAGCNGVCRKTQAGAFRSARPAAA